MTIKKITLGLCKITVMFKIPSDLGFSFLQSSARVATAFSI